MGSKRFLKSSLYDLLILSPLFQAPAIVSLPIKTRIILNYSTDLLLLVVETH